MEQEISCKLQFKKAETQNEVDALRLEFEEFKRQYRRDLLLSQCQHREIEVVDIGRKCEEDEYEKKGSVINKIRVILHFLITERRQLSIESVTLKKKT